MEPNETTNTENVLTIDSVCGNLENAIKRSAIITVTVAALIVISRVILNGGK